MVAAFAASYFSGPLPDPETFGAYEAVYPGVAKSIVEMAMRNQRHRIDVDRQNLRQDRKLANTARLSLILTWTAVMSLVAAGTYLGANGQPILGGIFGTAGIAPVLIVLIKGGGAWSGRADNTDGDEADE
jgi:uncharacterized membrane protein